MQLLQILLGAAIALLVFPSVAMAELSSIQTDVSTSSEEGKSFAEEKSSFEEESPSSVGQRIDAVGMCDENAQSLAAPPPVVNHDYGSISKCDDASQAALAKYHGQSAKKKAPHKGQQEAKSRASHAVLLGVLEGASTGHRELSPLSLNFGLERGRLGLSPVDRPPNS